jgi:hypothetical protein
VYENEKRSQITRQTLSRLSELINLSEYGCERLDTKRAMKQRYHSYRRENGIYYSLDTFTNKRQSLNTSDAEHAQRLVNASNEACRQPTVNLQIARVYLQHSDPDYAKRTWQHVMNEMAKTKDGSTRVTGQ